MNRNTPLWLFSGLQAEDWWTALLSLEAAAEDGGNDTVRAYAQLFRALLAAGHDSVPAAFAEQLMTGPLPLGVRQLRTGSPRAALELDLVRFNRLAATDWHARAGAELPALSGLNLEPDTADSLFSGLAASLAAGTLSADALFRAWETRGQGLLARGTAFRFQEGRLSRLRQVRADEFQQLHGLERQTGELRNAVEPWLSGRPPVHVLLYGPRGSGKSTAARSLLSAYGEQGLRLVELPPAGLSRLPELLGSFAASPLRFVIFIDDLGFGADDAGWQDLKTVLDGTLEPLPENVLLLATTNRRTLVPARFSDRPDPLDDDAHAWDTQDEKLALADRFGLVITFPAADQRRYLHIVEALAREEGLGGEDLEAEALLFARRQNGFSGRTARQFIDSRSG